MGIFINEFADPPFTWGDNEYAGTGSDTTKDLVEDKYSRTMLAADNLLLVCYTAMEDMDTAIVEFAERVVTVPTLTTPSLPGTNPTAPSIADDSAVFTATLSRLLTDLVSGARGVDAAVEAEIWARGDARFTLQEEADQLEIEQYFSSRGFELPTGAVTGKLQEHLNERARNRLEFNGKIMIEQAELAQKNSQFAITAATNIKNTLLGAATEVYSTQVTDVNNQRMQVIELFKTEVAKAQLTVQAQIAEIETALGGYTAVQSLRERVANAKANLGMQGYASAVGSVNMNASLSHQTGRQESESYNHSENRQISYSRDIGLSESHNFEEDPSV